MQGEAQQVLGQRVVDGRGLGIGLLDDAGDEAVGREATGLDEARDGPVAAVSLPSSSRMARTLRPCTRSSRRSMSWVSSSRPASTSVSRTLLSDSLIRLNGMSRAREKTIIGATGFFLAALAMVISPRRAAGSLSLDLQPVTKQSAALFL